MKIQDLLLPALLASFLAACSGSEEEVVAGDGDANVNEGDTATNLPADFLGNAACPMSGNPVDPEQFVEHNGEKIYFCCGDCVATGQKDPDKYRNQVYADAKAVDNETCPVTGEAIGDAPNKGSWQGHEVALCCGFCENGFAGNPEHFTKVAMGLEAADDE